jgi:hypothetical protein
VLEVAAEAIGEERLGRLVQVGTHRWRADHAAGLSGRVSESRAAVQAAGLGMPVQASRAALVSQVSGPSPAQVDALARECASLATVAAAQGQAARWQQVVRLLETASSRAEFLQLAVLAAEPDVQQQVVAGMDAEHAADAMRRWTQVVAVCPPEWAPGPLGLLGVASWLTGDGALLTVCLERLDELAASSPLAAMLDWINATVLPPGAWPRYRSALAAAVGDHARLMSSLSSVWPAQPA